MSSLISIFRQAPEKVIVGDVRLGLVESYVRQFKANTTAFDNCSKKDLSEMRFLAIKSGLNETHDFVKKIDDLMKKTPGISTGLISRKPIPSEETNSNTSVFRQGALKNAEVLQVLAQRGKEITELTLNEATDEVMEKLPELCPNLTFLSVNERLDYQLSRSFTDHSLVCIGKLTKLTKLELNLWLNLTISTDAVQTLLSQPHLQNNLTELRISMAARVTDGAMETLAAFKSLKTFELKCSSPTTSSGIETFVSSSTSKATLENLKLEFNNVLGGLTFTDNIAYYIGCLPQLKSLELVGEWTAVKYIDSMISNLKKIEVLKIGAPVTKEGLQKLSATVKDLHLGDTSKLASSDYDNLLQGRKLEKVSFGKAVNFQDGNMEAVVKMPLQHFGLEGAPIVHGLDTLKEKAPGLQSLHLRNLAKATNKSLALEGFTQLQTLKISNCPEFNDSPFKKILENLKSITTLELDQVFVSDTFLPKLGKMVKLRSLTLSNLKAVTKWGVEQLLATVGLRERIVDLNLINLKMSKDAINNLISFVSLRAFSVFNGWTTAKKENYFDKTVKPLREKNVFVQSGGGT